MIYLDEFIIGYKNDLKLTYTKMKKLIIYSAPNQSSFTHKIVAKLKEKYPNSELIDLYSNEYKLDFLKFEDKRNMPTNPIVEKIQKKIKESDEMIFVFPVWWWNCPAIMKNMIDSVFISWFAFEYTAEWKKELLSDKFASVIATCDAPWNIYLQDSAWTWINLKDYFEKAIFGFSGIKLKDFKLIDKLRERRKTQEKEILENL